MPAVDPVSMYRIARAEVLQRHGDRVEHASEIDVHRVDERAGDVFLDRQDAGVGADDVEASELGDPRLDGCSQLVTLADIRLEREDPLARRFDLSDGVVHVVLRPQRVANRVDRIEEIDGDDVRPLLREPDAVALALSASPLP